MRRGEAQCVYSSGLIERVIGYHFDYTIEFNEEYNDPSKRFSILIDALVCQMKIKEPLNRVKIINGIYQLVN